MLLMEGWVGVGECGISKGGEIQELGKRYGMGTKMEIIDGEMVGSNQAIEQGIKERRIETKQRMTVRVNNE